MNVAAYEENVRNKAAIKTDYRQGVKVYEIDTRKATYRHTPVRLLDSRQKRKFENLLVLLDEERIPKKFIYHY